MEENKTKTKKFLIFDTETTGLFNRKDNVEKGIVAARDPLIHPEDYPRIFQIAFILFDEEGKILYSRSDFIKPDGWEIPSGPGNEFWEDHGYSTDLCEKEGEDITELLKDFRDCLVKSDYIVAHNLDFDLPILLSEFKNYNIFEPENFITPKQVCTMKSTIDFVKANHSKENIDKYPWLEFNNKFPRLEELYFKLFKTTFNGAHDALVDVTATYKCMKELVKLGIIKL